MYPGTGAKPEVAILAGKFGTSKVASTTIGLSCSIRRENGCRNLWSIIGRNKDKLLGSSGDSKETDTTRTVGICISNMKEGNSHGFRSGVLMVIVEEIQLMGSSSHGTTINMGTMARRWCSRMAHLAISINGIDSEIQAL